MRTFKSYQESIQYYDELKQIAHDISIGKLSTSQITKKQRDKFSKVDEWW